MDPVHSYLHSMAMFVLFEPHLVLTALKLTAEWARAVYSRHSYPVTIMNVES